MADGSPPEIAQHGDDAFDQLWMTCSSLQGGWAHQQLLVLWWTGIVIAILIAVAGWGCVP